MKTVEPPKDDGGATVTKYVVELSEGLSGESQMPMMTLMLEIQCKKTNISLFVWFFFL